MAKGTHTIAVKEAVGVPSEALTSASVECQ
jgi:hypothetical protein